MEQPKNLGRNHLSDINPTKPNWVKVACSGGYMWIIIYYYLFPVLFLYQYPGLSLF